MRILGIDPGLGTCGYGCVEAESDERRVVEAGTICTSEGEKIELRLGQIAEDMAALLERLRPEVVAVEQLYSHYAHPRTAILMGHARGVILAKCAQMGVEVRSFSATKIKKSITGSGRASKEQVQRAVRTILGLTEVPEPTDVADAIAAAVCCADSMKSADVLGGER